MAELPDLYPGFDTHFIDVPGAKIFTRTGGNGPPLLLLHGYPQTHVCWHKVAPELARHFTLVIPDLRGYGASTGPAADSEGDVPHLAYSKRAMAADFVAMMRVLGYDRFAVASRPRCPRCAGLRSIILTASRASPFSTSSARSMLGATPAGRP